MRKRVAMDQLQQKREFLIKTINDLSEDQLKLAEELLQKVLNNDKHSVEYIYARAVEKYHETLQKPAK